VTITNRTGSRRAFAALAAAIAIPAGAFSQPAARVEEDVLVLGRWDNPIGQSTSASEGVVGAAELDARPRMRTGEILEVVPGLIVTQHSGTGKSNQLFLRGFNLDHGTDFATWIDGMPVNLPTHAHGQGYTDLNFLIPELVERLEYRKGAYYAEVSEFSSAGAAYLSTYESLPAGMVKAGFGEDGYFSALAADSFGAGSGELLYGVQVHRYDGPWSDIDEDVRRDNLLLRYSERTDTGGWNVALMSYDADWNSPDQIPRRAVESGLISPLGSIDETLGGETSRHSLSGSWTGEVGSGRLRANAFAIDYDLELFSNFTYFLDDPVDGDQFAQRDDRTITGGEVAYTFGEPGMSHTFGAMLRNDDIGGVGLFHTAQRRPLNTIRSDSVDELSVGVYYSNETRWTDKLRTTLGVRADHFDFDVASELAVNSGSASESIFAPKASLIYSATSNTELYLSAGKGFHSNDARGTTITVDPVSGDPADKVNPLVDAHELEVGFRTFVDRKLNVSAALWLLELDSELLFIGDAGNTEASRPSRRYGIEVPVYYRPNDRLTFDVELALTRSRFTELVPAGDEIPGSIDRVVAAGITLQNPQGFHGSLRLRYFGPRPLIEDGSIESDSSTVVNLALGYKRKQLDFRVDVLNLLDSDDDDVTYWYASRLPGEPDEGVEDYHSHPIEPRNLRLYVGWTF
jgi:outer membrane receptor protein involved in Fe transport